MIKRSWCFVAAMTLLVVTVSSSPSYSVGMAKLIIKVIDENNQPIDGAQVRVRFQGGGLDKDRKRGVTDEEGMFSASGLSSDGSTGGGVDKEGYYTSVFHHDFYRNSFGIWQPWGKELNVAMRPVVNPVPMHVLDLGVQFPDFGKNIGFDLIKADWVIPYGQGTHADFIFKIDRQYDDTDNYEVKMTLTFSNPLDGIQVVKEGLGGDFNAGSRYRLPRTAPIDGYQPKLQSLLSRGSYGWHSDRADDNNYIFRVRSEIDEGGNLKRAMYGKIRGNLDIYASGEISMHYYLNPDYTRNLEFDPKRNLSVGDLSRGNLTHP